ncbi:MAG: ribokinase [Blastocatellia bacterium]|nr:ribokinase [Blastocatellia bacterium]
MSTAQISVVVIGSLNMDFVMEVAQLPLRGETVPGRGFVTLSGGKGANQACAVGRLLGRPGGAMVGCVGEDLLGHRLVESLQAAGIDTGWVRVMPEAPTGVAMIVVETGGQNQIVVSPGANDCLGPEEATAALTALGGSHLLLQLETPLATVEAAARHARSLGMTVILDPAPARPLPAALLQCVDLLTPNESEALALAELGGSRIELSEAPAIAARLRARGPEQVILKLGEQGAYVMDGTGGRHFPARRVTATDATAAGDCFNGALAAGLADGMGLAQAVEFAIAAASISVTRRGAQASIPDRREVDSLIDAAREERT